jgi:hypothetical protein
MTEQTLPQTMERAVRAQQTVWSALLVGVAIFGLLWILNIPYRENYVPGGGDIPALADGLLLSPNAHWTDWFTQGYSHFWDRYPEWPQGDSAFTRPAFQFVIYLAHFALGRNWASYQVINCFAAGGIATVVFLIARTALGLRAGSSLLATVLVLLSPPVLESWILGLAFAIEPLATVLTAGAFLAVIARRDILCLTLLFAALLTKENTLWAPVAAGISVMLRPRPNESLYRRIIVSAAMFMPIAMWLSLRFAFFHGIGGTYATSGYTPVADFLNLTFYKLMHIDNLFVNPSYFMEWHWEWKLLDRTLRIGTRLLIYALFCLWAIHILSNTVSQLRKALHDKAWPTADATLLVALWAAVALAFHFALPLRDERYATSIAVFVWPALVAEIERRRKFSLWLALAACGIVLLVRTADLSKQGIATAKFLRTTSRTMDAALRAVPEGTPQVYVMPADRLHGANPEYVRLVLGINAKIVILADIQWDCKKSNKLVSFDHSTIDGVVNIAVSLPACAKFRFSGQFGDTSLENGRLYRNGTITYELPEAFRINSEKWWDEAFYLGRKMILHVRPSGPARFIIQHGGPGGIASFDTP